MGGYSRIGLGAERAHHRHQRSADSERARAIDSGVMAPAGVSTSGTVVSHDVGAANPRARIGVWASGGLGQTRRLNSMAMSRSDRFRLKSKLVDVLLGDEDWDYGRINLLLGEFALEPLDSGHWGEEIASRLATVPDDELVELYSIVTGTERAEVRDVVESGENPGNWKTGYVRLFLSHSAEYKDYVGHVAKELAVVGIDGFVAHDNMEIAAPWQAQIELALRSMDAFTAFVHPGFNDRPWCQQEVGWAFGRRVPRFAIRMGEDPKAFLSSDQWPSGVSKSAKHVAGLISGWMSGLSELGDTVLAGLLKALESANNYFDAEAAAKRITALGSPSEGLFRRIDEVWWRNDQLYGGVLPTKVMSRFYRDNGRDWPPPKPPSPN